MLAVRAAGIAVAGRADVGADLSEDAGKGAETEHLSQGYARADVAQAPKNGSDI